MHEKALTFSDWRVDVNTQNTTSELLKFRFEYSEDIVERYRFQSTFELQACAAR